MPDEPQPAPQPVAQQPIVVSVPNSPSGGVVGVAMAAADAATRWTDKQINNAVMLALAAVVAFLIYVDRRDRAESDGRNLRFFESQSEQNRQVITANTTAVQALSVQVGKLESTVNSLHRTVTAMSKDKEPEEVVVAPMPKLKPITPEP